MKKCKASKGEIWAITEASDTLDLMISQGEEFDNKAKKIVRLIERFLTRNNLKLIEPSNNQLIQVI